MRSWRHPKCAGNHRTTGLGRAGREGFALATALAIAVSATAPVWRAAVASEQPTPPTSPAQPTHAPASNGVNLHILVIEASKREGTFDARIRGNVRKHLEDVGYTGARVMDELSTQAVSEGARVQLEILSMGKPRSAQHLRVTALSVSQSEVRLRVEIPEFRFDTSTRQKPDTTVALAFKTPEGSQLYLAVTPTL
ncbi:MAG: hypothetical protein H6729_04770 [Deltaproteobacteria bacterium]|nr:hypothetical protein [Deltaproteobacteria bacterium]